MKSQASSAKRQAQNPKRFDCLNFRNWNLFEICDLEFRIYRQGFTVVETIISISVLALLAVFIVNGLETFRESSSLDRAVDEALEILREARSKTLGSEQASNYGVHFEAESMTLFRGGSYDSSGPENIVVVLPSLVSISAVNLSTTTANVTFERLSGEAEADGTLTFATTRSSKTRQIQILPAGLFFKL